MWKIRYHQNHLARRRTSCGVDGHQKLEEIFVRHVDLRYEKDDVAANAFVELYKQLTVGKFFDHGATKFHAQLLCDPLADCRRCRSAEEFYVGVRGHELCPRGRPVFGYLQKYNSF